MRDWLYFDVYPGGAHLLDELVRHAIAPLAAQTAALPGVDRWHYLRYTDELGAHVRFRIGEPLACRAASRCPLLRRSAGRRWPGGGASCLGSGCGSGRCCRRGCPAGR